MWRSLFKNRKVNNDKGKSSDEKKRFISPVELPPSSDEIVIAIESVYKQVKQSELGYFFLV